MTAKSHWIKRSLSMLLICTFLLQCVPFHALAAAPEPVDPVAPVGDAVHRVPPVVGNANKVTVMYGDITDDGKVNNRDLGILQQYLNGYGMAINTEAADVTHDGKVNNRDLGRLQQYLNGWDVKLEPDVKTYTVSFYDGERLIDAFTVEEGQPLGMVPAVEKSSKANGILLGYFTDPEFTQPFYAENPVTGDMTVYAKYEDMGPAEELSFTSFAQMDQPSDVSFEVVGTGDPTQAVTLEVKDGSDPVELKFEATADGYIVSAVGGFNEGSSYQLHLADGWTFKDKPDTIRTAAFSIFMEQVENMQMGDGIVYIQDTDAITYTVGGQSYDMLTSDLITEQGGSFTYSGAAIKPNDLLCIYTGIHPEERGFDGDMLDPAFYVKVKAINGSAITFTALDEDDLLRLYNVPDNFPIKVDALPTGTTGTVNVSALDVPMYTTMMGDGYDLAKAKSEIEVGDFISVYVSMDDTSTDEDVYFGEITAYNAATGEITFKQTTKQAIMDCMDLYRDVEVSGDDLITEDEKEEIEAVILDQIQDSGFAEDAAFMLADMVSKTDGFKNANLNSLLITDSRGNPIDPEALQLMNLGKSFELTDDIKLTVEIITKGDRLHYKNGTQIAVGVEAEFAVELEDDEKIAIELSATFVQEVEISPKIKGYIVPYVIFLIPVPVGANINGTIDIKSFTAFSFEAEIYTVGPEDESLWDQFQDVMKNPEKLADVAGLPTELSEGLKTAGDVLDKIEEIKEDLSKIKDTAEGTVETIEGYAKDIELLWTTIDHVITEEDYSVICEALGKANVTSELLDMMELTTKTGLETEYYESLDALMDRYCEMVEKETDWVTLLEKDIFAKDVCVYGIAIGIDVDFLVRADLSLAIGSNLQYEVGKRYEFWFKFAPFWKKAGCETMDLLDERFAFQFYAMGRLGLKAGIRAKLECGIGSCTLANVGVSLELGPYMKLWGFFVYEYEKYRPANTNEWHSDQRMAGALLMEFGLYLKLACEAEALSGIFSYEYEFLDKEFPLLTVGDRKYYYAFAFTPKEDEVIVIKDEDDNPTNGTAMKLPNDLIGLKYLEMAKGFTAVETLDYGNYHLTFTNPNFAFDKKTGKITVTVPQGTRYMECDLIATYKHGKLAFSTYDMTVTIPLVWTNMTDAELNEYYTASVRVGNNEDGYTTVWQQRVLKNSEFALPTVDEIKELIGWNDYKYVMGTGYGNQQTEGLTLIEDKVYDFNIDYQTYSITVNGVQNADGSTTGKTYYADFGETFDFSDLDATGTNANGVYTKFFELTHNVAGLDLNKAIDTRMAAILATGVAIDANYVDDSITATFRFVRLGADVADVTVTLRRGDTPDLSAIEAIVADYGMDIKDIVPIVAPIRSSTTYQVVCGELDTAPATITFVENGGSDVADITKPAGSLIGNLPTPTKQGYTFDGWYADEALTQPFTLTKVPQDGATAYAKWTVNTVTVSFHVNGGNELDSADAGKIVNYGEAYGELPKPTKSGYGFVGWFTATEGGEQVTADTVVSTTEKHTLYAQWRQLIEQPDDAFSFTPRTFTYEKGKDYGFFNLAWCTSLRGGLTPDDFTYSFLAEGYEDEGYVERAYEAGVYGIKVTRPADDTFAKFEAFYPGVLVIQKATRYNQTGISVISGTDLNDVYKGKTINGMTYLSLYLMPNDWENPSLDALYHVDNPSSPNKFSDADPDIRLTLTVYAEGITLDNMGSATVLATSGPCDPFSNFKLYGLVPGTTYSVIGKLTNDRNYHDSYFFATAPLYKYAHSFKTDDAPTGDNWSAHADTSWYNSSASEFTLTTPEQLAGLAKLVNGGTGFFKKTVKLGADLDMSRYIWIPIGGDGYQFQGSFDGCGHTVSGMYCKDTNRTTGTGMFGEFMPEDREDGNTYLKDLVVYDSYFYGRYYVGGIAAYIGGTTVTNCVSYATVKANHNNTLFSSEYNSFAGGLFGVVAWYSGIVNCVNYGSVTTAGNYVGGIAGYLNGKSYIVNCVNFGNVRSSRGNVGGIVGVAETSEYEAEENEQTKVINNYNFGMVYGGNNTYVGAVAGRNVSDRGIAQFNYYLYGCATDANGNVRYAMGTKSGSVTDGDKSYFASSFETVESTMKGSAADYSGMTLIEALNAWVATNGSKYGASNWVVTEDGAYPLPEGIPTPA